MPNVKGLRDIRTSLLEEGQYLVKCIDAQLTTAKTGGRMYALTLEVLDGPIQADDTHPEGQILNHNLVVGDSTMRAGDSVASLGLAEWAFNIPKTRGVSIERKFIGCTASARVVSKTDADGTMRETITMLRRTDARKRRCSEMSEMERSRIVEIRRLYGEIQGCMRMSLDAAIKIGELITKQKAGMKHGEFTLWVGQNTPLKHRTAQDYMRFYRHKDALKNAKLADLTEAREEIARQQDKLVEYNARRDRLRANSKPPEDWTKKDEQRYRYKQKRAEERRAELERFIKSSGFARLSGYSGTFGEYEDFKLFDPKADQDQEQLFRLLGSYIKDIDPDRRLQVVHNLIKKLKQWGVDIESGRDRAWSEESVAVDEADGLDGDLAEAEVEPSGEEPEAVPVVYRKT